MILWGPPGVGKTTIANIIANTLQVPFYTLSAISSGVKDIREVIELARRKHAVLFIDEIHRFNKGQQDALLGRSGERHRDPDRRYYGKPLFRSKCGLAVALPGVCAESAGRA